MEISVLRFLFQVHGQLLYAETLAISFLVGLNRASIPLSAERGNCRAVSTCKVALPVRQHSFALPGSITLHRAAELNALSKQPRPGANHQEMREPESCPCFRVVQWGTGRMDDSISLSPRFSMLLFPHTFI